MFCCQDAPAVCWGDGFCGDPIGGNAPPVPVGVVGLLENPEPPPKLAPRAPMSAKGSRVCGLDWWVGVLWTDPVGLVHADLLPIPNPPAGVGLLHSQPPIRFGCWIFTVGVVGGTGEVLPGPRNDPRNSCPAGLGPDPNASKAGEGQGDEDGAVFLGVD